MALFDEKVPKALLDAETNRREAAEAREAQHLARIDVLTDRIATMRRRERFDAPPAQRAPVLQKDHRLSDKQIVDEAEQNFITRLTADIEREGIDPKAARAEAERIRRDAMSTTLHPAE